MVGLSTVIFLAVLFGCTALTIDVGLLYLQRQRLQAATDMAALTAVNGVALGTQTTLMNTSIGKNPFVAPTTQAAVAGTYQPNAAVAAGARFTPGGSPPNAVQVNTTLNAPLYFARVLSPQTSALIHATATATRQDLASFGAGTGLASLNAGLANQLLSGFLGSSVSLSLVQYDGLLDADVNLLGVLDGLATQVGLSAGTYNQVLASNVSAGQFLSAAISALSNSQTPGNIASVNAAVASLQALRSQISGSPSFALGSLVSAGFLQNAPVGAALSSSAASAQINLYQLVMFAAQAANGRNAVALNLGVNLGGLANVTAYLTLIEPFQYVTLSPVGTVIHTAQVRLLLVVNVLQALSFGGQSGLITLPIYIELASGTVTLQSISCGASPATDATVTLGVQTGVGNIYITNVTPAMLSNVSQPVVSKTPPPPVPLVSLLGLAMVDGSASLPIVASGAGSLTFTQSDINARPAVMKSLGSAVGSQAFISQLGSGLSLSVVLLGSPLLGGLLNGLTTAVASILSPVFQILGSALDPLLNTLGISIGNTFVVVTGVRCGVETLTQ